MDRKLVTIRQVTDIQPIEGKDRIVLAQVGGWNCIVQKSEFNIGDKCIYAECDAIFPPKPEFAFLEKRKYRIKPIKFAGILSQGLALPLTNYPQFKDMEIGTEVTNEMEVIKYESPTENEGGNTEPSKGSFPSYLGFSITDETRFESEYEIRHELHGKVCVITVKLDGSSITHFHKDGYVGTCSRKLEKKDTPESKWWDITRKYNLHNNMPILRLVNAKRDNEVEYTKYVLGGDEGNIVNFALQSEATGSQFKGSGKHGNALGVDESDMWVYNVYDIDNHAYMDYDRACEVIRVLGLKKVPVITDVFVFDKEKHTPEYFYKMMENMKYEGTDTPIEGIVLRSVQNFYSNVLKGRASVKILNPLFDLKAKE